MTTEDIAHALKRTSQLMELHEVNPFKIKSIANAAFKLNKTDIDLSNKSLQELEKIEGIGKSIANKIVALQTTGTLKEWAEMVSKTQEGVIDPFFKAHGYSNFYILDGSIVPCNLGVNPSLTITALSEYAMSHIPKKEGSTVKTLEERMNESIDCSRKSMAT